MKRRLRDRLDFTVFVLGLGLFVLAAAAESFTGALVGLVIMAAGAFKP